MAGVSIAQGVVATDPTQGGTFNNTTFTGTANGIPRIIAQSGNAASITGTLVETTLATIVIPGGTLSANGQLQVKAYWGFSGANGTRDQRIRINGTAVYDTGAVAATQNSMWSEWFMYNTNSLTTQTRINTQQPNAANSLAPSIGAFNTANDMTITLTEQLGNVADTATLLAFTVTILNP